MSLKNTSHVGSGPKGLDQLYDEYGRAKQWVTKDNRRLGCILGGSGAFSLVSISAAVSAMPTLSFASLGASCILLGLWIYGDFRQARELKLGEMARLTRWIREEYERPSD